MLRVSILSIALFFCAAFAFATHSSDAGPNLYVKNASLHDIAIEIDKNTCFSPNHTANFSKNAKHHYHFKKNTTNCANSDIKLNLYQYHKTGRTPLAQISLSHSNEQNCTVTPKQSSTPINIQCSTNTMSQEGRATFSLYLS